MSQWLSPAHRRHDLLIPSELHMPVEASKKKAQTMPTSANIHGEVHTTGYRPLAACNETLPMESIFTKRRKSMDTLVAGRSVANHEQRQMSDTCTRKT